MCLFMSLKAFSVYIDQQVQETECRKCQEFSEVGMTERSKL